MGPSEVMYARNGEVSLAYGLAFEERGAAELKGVPGEWRLYALQEDGGP